tara:strand:+ start:226 stop:2331 length:2106 start_codon:yes stop_codon:yes gene_type:complete
MNKIKFFVLGMFVALALGFSFSGEDDASKKDKVILNLIYGVLNQSHFSPQTVDDDFSEKVFDHFIENMDYSKRYLLKSDIESLDKYKKHLDDELRTAELDFFDEAYAIYNKRFGEIKNYYQDILSAEFDFDKKEKFETDDEKLDFVSNEVELKDRWRKYLKNRVLNRIEDKIEEQENAIEKKDTSVVIKSFETLEQEAREKELELHNDWYESLMELERMDWVAVYVNSITNIYDPHTQYFAPEKKEDFEISMTGQLQGIGAQLLQKGDYVTITKIITGSACWKQGELEVGDKILAVKQGDKKEEEAVNLVGMSVRKAVKYIRGPKGSEVILSIQKIDGSKQTISIIRDVVEIGATFAKSAVIGEGEDKVGYIRLPKFYVNFYEDSNRDCAEDVRKEIEKLKAEKVKSIVLDLRNNGGGSLQGVIDIVGLFIKDGPVVQVKAPGKNPRVLRDSDNRVAYDGPLVVMVNQLSASASEIFAAAIQDYKRGIIIGSKSTFGKGTVQNVFDMDRALGARNNDLRPIGALKLTIQKYYRINGGTPQLKGVNPEIVMPDNYSYIKFGEREQDFALPYDEIETAEYEVWENGTDKYPKAIANSKERIENNEKFDLIDEYAKWLKEEQENSVVSLNFEDFRAEREAFREKSEKYKGIRKSEEDLLLSGNKEDLKLWKENEEKNKEAEQWFKSLKNDIYLSEAFAVALDLS